ncbi:MAG: hypothetical protein WBQ23_06160, partial [Bacteroidota bacterium]
PGTRVPGSANVVPAGLGACALRAESAIYCSPGRVPGEAPRSGAKTGQPWERFAKTPSPPP